MDKKERKRLLKGVIVMALFFCAIASIGWTKQEFAITYFYGFDGKYETHIVNKGYIEDPLDPGRFGYVFDGWYYTDKQGNEILFDFESERVTTDLELTAHWKPYETEFHFDAMGGECETDFMLVPYGSEVTLPTPERKGYHFIGWMSAQRWMYPMSRIWENPIEKLHFYACWSKFPAGTSYFIGEYEQNIAIYEDEKLVGWEKEPLEWVPIDKKDGKYLLVTKYIIDTRSLGSKPGQVHWAQSDVRKWLNGEFYNTVFTDEERAMICDFTDEELGTTDKVFLLSIEESKLLCGSDLYANGTEYAYEKGLEDPMNCLEMTIDEETLFFYGWMTRSFDDYKNWHICGGALGTPSAYKPAGIRPAIWVDASLLCSRSN